MAKGKNIIECQTMGAVWYLSPATNLFIQIVVGLYSIIFGIIKPLKKIINSTLYYTTIILFILFKSLGLKSVAKTIRAIADQFIIANTPWKKRMKFCKKFGRLSKKINVKKFKNQYSQGIGADRLERDEDDNI